MKTFTGTIVRFDHSGVGVVKVPELDRYVYFKPHNIRGYQGETVDELVSRPNAWKPGKMVTVEGEQAPAIDGFSVSSITLNK